MEERFLAGERYIRDGPDGQTIIGTKAVRKINQWDAEPIIGVTDRPMGFFGHRQVKAKQKLIALASPATQMIDEEAEEVSDQTLSKVWQSGHLTQPGRRPSGKSFAAIIHKVSAFT